MQSLKKIHVWAQMKVPLLVNILLLNIFIANYFAYKPSYVSSL